MNLEPQEIASLVFLACLTCFVVGVKFEMRAALRAHEAERRDARTESGIPVEEVAADLAVREAIRRHAEEMDEKARERRLVQEALFREEAERSALADQLIEESRHYYPTGPE